SRSSTVLPSCSSCNRGSRPRRATANWLRPIAACSAASVRGLSESRHSSSKASMKRSAGVVFAVEELAKSFEKRTHATVILVVVVSGFTSYAMQGDYAYFGVSSGKDTLGSAWLLAPVIGLVGGLFGGAFAKAVAYLTGPDSNPVSD